MKKIYLFLLFSNIVLGLNAQVNVSLKIAPPFTPFISDYIAPARLNDIDLSLFNSSTSELKLKFKFSLVNASKGVVIAIKDNVVPNEPLILQSNEFKIMTLDDVVKLYGNLTQDNFIFQGVNIETVLLDGTLPDGTYEICIQAYDYNQPNFSVPLSASNPFGCAMFTILYPDGPTDVRLDNHLLNYSYGSSTIPKIEYVNFDMQSHTVSFTRPTYVAGSQYQYELLIFDENVLNPRQMNEAQMREAINTLQPYINKTSNLSTFFIDQSDMPLEKGKNYYLFIKVTDLANKTVFKNGGLSPIQAFQLYNNIKIKVEIPSPSIKSNKCDSTNVRPGQMIALNWDYPLDIPIEYRNKLKIRIKGIRIDKNASIPTDIFDVEGSSFFKDTTFISEGNTLSIQLPISDVNYFKKFVFGVQYIQDNLFENGYFIDNNGKSFEYCSFITELKDMPDMDKDIERPKPEIKTQLTLALNYPLANDTIPFQFPPVVIDITPSSDTAEIGLMTFLDCPTSEFSKNSDVFYYTNNTKKQKQVLSLSYDSLTSRIRKELEYSNLNNTELNLANQLDKYCGYSWHVQPKNIQHLVLGSSLILSEQAESDSAVLKEGISIFDKVDNFRRAMSLSNEALAVGGGSNCNVVNEDIDSRRYIRPNYNQIKWKANVGVINTLADSSIENQFTNFLANNTFNSTKNLPYKSLENNFNVGMKTPILQSFNGQTIRGTGVLLKFIPSKMPNKLFPTNVSESENSHFQRVNVSQQYNIEISSSPKFEKDKIIISSSKKINRSYDLVKDQSKVIEDFYTEKSIKFNLNDSGKYYWRITWSNIDLADCIDISLRVLRNDGKINETDKKKLDSLYGRENQENFYNYDFYAQSYLSNLTRFCTEMIALGLSDYWPDMLDDSDSSIFRRKDYLYSNIDSFVFIKDNDQFSCGSGCEYTGTDLNTSEQSSNPDDVSNNVGLKVGDTTFVGKFKMIIKEVRYGELVVNGRRSYNATGKGEIQIPLFLNPIQVFFTDCKFNYQKRMLDGDVIAENKLENTLKNVLGDVNVLGVKGNLYDVISSNIKAAGKEDGEKMMELANLLANSAAAYIPGGKAVLPVGLGGYDPSTPETVDKKLYQLSIVDMKFNARRAFINILAMFPIQGTEHYVSFGAKDFCLTPEGMDVTAGGKLTLIKDITFPYLNDSLFMSFKGDQPNKPGCSIEFGCSGFKSINVVGEIDMPKEWMVKEVNEQPSNEKVKAFFSFNAKTFDHWVAGLSFGQQPIQLKVLKDWSFVVNEAYFDFSDVMNPLGMQFPEGYRADMINNPTWRGFYMGKAMVTLPKNIFKKNDNSRISFETNNLLIDGTGISGNVLFNNLISENDCNMAGFKFGMRELKFSVVSNAFTSGEIKGKIGIPITTSLFDYSVLLSKPINQEQLDYNFKINPANNVEIPLWVANANIYNTSVIKINNLGGSGVNQAQLVVALNGEISLGGDVVGGVKDIKFNTLPFEGLKLSVPFNDPSNFNFKLEKIGGVALNETNYSMVSASGGGSNSPSVPELPNKAGGFNLTIKGFKLDNLENSRCLFGDTNPLGKRFGVKFKIAMDIGSVGSDGSGSAFSGDCGVGIYGLAKFDNNVIDFKFAGVNLDTIRLNAKIGSVVEVQGALAFINNDAVFGNGFVGKLKAKFQPGIEVGVGGIFGKTLTTATKTGFNYWMVSGDFNVAPESGIYFYEVVGIYGFTATAWYKMKIDGNNGVIGGNALGTSFTGNLYKPDFNTFFGCEAAVKLTGPKGANVYGTPRLAAEFSNQGGLNRLILGGDLWFGDYDISKAPAYFNGNIEINVAQSFFKGNMNAYLNVANGAVRGNNAVEVINGKNYYKAGALNFNVNETPGKWYFKAGDPFVSNGQLGIALYSNNTPWFQAQSYLMLGNGLPSSMPPLPSQVTDIFSANGKSINRTSVFSFDPNNPSFAMGASMTIPNKNIDNIAPFYARFGAVLGYDMKLGAISGTCNSRNGINGMYATGQAFAALDAKIGIEVDAAFYKGKIDILNINAASVLEAGAFNPIYFNGRIVGRYSVMDGLISGDFDEKLKYEEEPGCTPKSTFKFKFGDIVSDVFPANNATDVIMGAEPTIASDFMMSLGTNTKENRFEFTKEDGTISSTRIKLNVKSIVFKEKNSTVVVPYTTQFESNNKVLKFYPNEVLKPNMLYNLSLKVEVQEFKNNAWVTMIRNSKVVDTNINITFRVELAPDSIPKSMIAYTTPYIGERYFKKGGVSNGTIKIKQNGFSNYFPAGLVLNPNTGNFSDKYKYYGLITNTENSSDNSVLNLTINSDNLTFPIPNTLQNSKKYMLTIVRETIKYEALSLTQTRIKTFNLTKLDTTNKSTLSTNSTTARSSGDERTVMFMMTFNTSKYNTYLEKTNALTFKDSIFKPSFALGVDTISFDFKTTEPFEMYEMLPFTYSKAGVNNSIAPPTNNFKLERTSACPYMFASNGYYKKEIYTRINTLLTYNVSVSKPTLSDLNNSRGIEQLITNYIKQPLSQSNFSYNVKQNLNMLNISSSSSNLNTVNFNVPDIYVSFRMFEIANVWQQHYLDLQLFANRIKNNTTVWNSLSATQKQYVNDCIVFCNKDFVMPVSTDRWKLLISNADKTKIRTFYVKPQVTLSTSLLSGFSSTSTSLK